MSLLRSRHTSWALCTSPLPCALLNPQFGYHASHSSRALKAAGGPKLLKPQEGHVRLHSTHNTQQQALKRPIMCIIDHRSSSQMSTPARVT